jgi:hypothetical protein
VSEAPDVHVTERATGDAPFCPYCRSSITRELEVWRCPRCETAQHRECLREHGRCVTYGCGSLSEITEILTRLREAQPRDRARADFFERESWWIARPFFWVFERLERMIGGVRPED